MSEPSFFKDLITILQNYFEAKLKLYKITAYEKTAKVCAALFSSIIITFLLFFLLFFLSLSAGFYFSELLNSNALGFLIIFGIYLILFIPIVIFRKTLLEKRIADNVVKQLVKQEEND